MESQLTTHNRRVETEVLTRQGLRLPPMTLKCLRTVGIYCQPSVSIEHQQLAKRYVLRGVESGGAVAEIGAYQSPSDLLRLCWPSRASYRICDCGGNRAGLECCRALLAPRVGTSKTAHRDRVS